MTDPKALPIWQYKNQLISALKENQVIIVQSPTGSGKTTQIPLILNEEGFIQNKIIGITQPRRIAAIGVCSYIQEQLKDDNSFCAYKIRFYDTTTENTKIKIMTDGILLEEIKTDPYLNNYSIIMIDEAHERSLNIDFILGLLKQICSVRKDLKIIISSATINTKVFADFFNAPVIDVKAKQFKVDVKYISLKKNNENDLYFHICRIINKNVKDFVNSNFQDSKDTLVFLPGEFEIKTCLNYIFYNCDYERLKVYLLYGRLNKEEQELVFEETPHNLIKVVLATNIAETSLTIDGIRVVIDSGLAKINTYNPFDFTSSLTTQAISKASAIQRKGRAGRTSDGICYRLYSEDNYNGREEFTVEEILRTDLSEVVLRMLNLGIKNFDTFPFITRPHINDLKSSIKTLKYLNAVDDNLDLTVIGNMMVKFPLLPRLSRCLIEALYSFPHIIHNIAICVSFLSSKSPFLLPIGEEDIARSRHRTFSSPFGDFLGYQILYKKYVELTDSKKKENFCNSYYLDFQSMEEIVHITEQLCSVCRDLGFPVLPFIDTFDENLAKICLICMGKGLIQYICVKMNKNSYKTLNVNEIYIHPGSAWFKDQPTYILAGELVNTSRLFARTVSPLKKEWLELISPDLYQKLKTEAHSTDKKNNEKISGKKISIYGYEFDVITENVKKQQNKLAVIPYQKLEPLYKANKKASRHPKNIKTAILFNGYYIGWNEKLYSNLMLYKKVKFDSSSIVSNLPQQIFSDNDKENNIEKLSEYLQILMKLSPLKKYKNHLGFVELISSKDAFFYHVAKSFTDAINNTAYSLLYLSDSDNLKNKTKKIFHDAYNTLIRLLD